MSNRTDTSGGAKRNRTPETYRDLAGEGFSKSATARALGVSVQAVAWMADRYGLLFVDGRPNANRDRMSSGSRS